MCSWMRPRRPVAPSTSSTPSPTLIFQTERYFFTSPIPAPGDCTRSASRHPSFLARTAGVPGVDRLCVGCWATRQAAMRVDRSGTDTKNSTCLRLLVGAIRYVTRGRAYHFAAASAVCLLLLIYTVLSRLFLSPLLYALSGWKDQPAHLATWIALYDGPGESRWVFYDDVVHARERTRIVCKSTDARKHRGLFLRTLSKILEKSQKFRSKAWKNLKQIWVFF